MFGGLLTKEKRKKKFKTGPGQIHRGCVAVVGVTLSKVNKGIYLLVVYT